MSLDSSHHINSKNFCRAQWKSPLACELLQEARDFKAEDNRRKGVRRSRRKKAVEERKRMNAVKNKEKAIDDSEERY